MREFFRGWRRKLGVMTLMMACMFAAIWTRSFFLGEYFIFPHHTLILSHGAIRWNEDVWTFDPGEFTWLTLKASSSEDEVIGGVQFRFWWIVFPLTTLSAYLVLSKPRVAKPPEAAKTPGEAKVTHA